MRRLWLRLTYAVERWFVRGAQYRLLFVAAMIGLISVMGGALVRFGGTGFEDFAGSVWWAFLRLTDPGYLGDDVGVVNRIVSTALTVLGYVVFLGALVAIMTQWLDARMQRLESGLTPVARDDHVLVLGWTNRTETIVGELLRSEERVRRFLRRHGARELHIVVMAGQVTSTLAQDLRDAVGDVWDERKVTLRTGNPIRTEHLARVDYRNASAIIVPGAEFGGSTGPGADVRAIKTLLSLGAAWSDTFGGLDGQELPLAVVEIADARKISAARDAYPGRLELIPGDAVVSRLVVQNVRHPGLSYVYGGLLSYRVSSELYVRSFPELAGASFEALTGVFPQAILLGFLRPHGDDFLPRLNPPPGFRSQTDDRYVLLADEFAGTDARGKLGVDPGPRGETGRGDQGRRDTRVLLLGWNHRVPAMLREFGSYAGERFSIDVLTTVPVEKRERLLQLREIETSRVAIRHVQGDYAELNELAALEPATYDTIVMLGSDRFASEEESDARTIVGSLLLRGMLPADGGPNVIIELLDPENVPLVSISRGEVIISPLVVSHILAQVALRHELRVVFEELFTAGGAEIAFRSPATYGLEPAGHTFAEVRRAAQAAGEVALGIRHGAEVSLNPSAETRLSADGRGDVVTLLSYR